MLRVQHGQIRLSTNVHHDMSQLCAVTGGSHDTSAKYCHSSNLHHSSTISQALTSSPCMLSSATGSLQWDSEFDVCNRHRR